jgi:peptide/nickel transport system permease protein
MTAVPSPNQSGKIAVVASPAAAAESIVRPGGWVGSTADEVKGDSRTQWQVFVESFRDHRAAWVSMWILVGMTLACIALPFVLPWSPEEIDYDILSATAPSLAHPLGTDNLGRDVLARLLAAGRISLLIGLMVSLISATIGATVGVVAGYFGGKVDEGMMWFVNVLMTIPALPLLIALSSVAASETGAVAGIFNAVPPEWRIIIILSLLGWMAISRVVRSQVISLRKQEFVEAAIALGGSSSRVMIVHILPNTISVLAVFTTLTVSTAIMYESSLSFLGLGVTPPTATWGNMLLEARDVFTALKYWWLTWSPALAILITVLCVNFMGDGMRDAFDPKAKK